MTNIFGELPPGVGPDTLAVQGGVARSAFQETSEGLYLTSGYIYDSAEEAERVIDEAIAAESMSAGEEVTEDVVEEVAVSGSTDNQVS